MWLQGVEADEAMMVGDTLKTDVDGGEGHHASDDLIAAECRCIGVDAGCAVTVFVNPNKVMLEGRYAQVVEVAAVTELPDWLQRNGNGQQATGTIPAETNAPPAAEL